MYALSLFLQTELIKARGRARERGRERRIGRLYFFCLFDIYHNTNKSCHAYQSTAALLQTMAAHEK